MESISNQAQKFILGIKKYIKVHYQNDYELLKILHDKRPEDELEYYYYLTYKDYDKLRIIMINILRFILHNLKNKKRKNKKKIILLMDIFNNTFFYVTYPNDMYLCKFQKFIYKILFIYYKDYIYKARLEYSYIKDLPKPVVVSLGFEYYQEEYDPIKLKILFFLFKKFRC